MVGFSVISRFTRIRSLLLWVSPSLFIRKKLLRHFLFQREWTFEAFATAVHDGGGIVPNATAEALAEARGAAAPHLPLRTAGLRASPEDEISFETIRDAHACSHLIQFSEEEWIVILFLLFSSKKCDKLNLFM